MGHAEYLKEMLRPLGVYDLEEGRFNTAELAGQGAGLDACLEELERVAREMMVCTAEDEGLERVETLLSYRPVTQSLEQRRQALAALLRIGEGSFTLKAICDTLKGCGINAAALETDTPGYVQVYFPDVPGVPEGYEELRKIIEEILPCHLGIEYLFWYVTWELMEEKFSTWGELEVLDCTWMEIEKIMK